jgi:hypothetical protein
MNQETIAMATTQTNELKLNDSILKLAAEIKKDITIGDGGAIVLDKGFYEKHLPENLSMTQVKDVQTHNSNIIAAATLALGEVGLPHLKKHKDLDTISLAFGVGKDKVQAQLKREVQVPDGLGKGGMRTKHGVISANYKVHASGNVGDFKKVREHIAAEGSKIWG